MPERSPAAILRPWRKRVNSTAVALNHACQNPECEDQYPVSTMVCGPGIWNQTGQETKRSRGGRCSRASSRSATLRYLDLSGDLPFADVTCVWESSYPCTETRSVSTCTAVMMLSVNGDVYSTRSRNSASYSSEGVTVDGRRASNRVIPCSDVIGDPEEALEVNLSLEFEPKFIEFDAHRCHLASCSRV